MATFVYKGYDKTGKSINGAIEAENEKLVVERLRQADYIVTSVQPKTAASGGFQLSFGNSVKLKDVAVFSRQFAIMVQSGIPMLRCLDILHQQQENKTFKNVLAQVKKSVEDGSTLSESFAAHPKVFPQVFVSMIRAGEVGGVLDEALERLAEHLDKEHELKEKIKSATTYPKVIFVFAIAVVCILVTFVVPQFASMFQSFGSKLPAITQFVLDLSHFMQKYFLFIIAAGALLAVLYVQYSKTPAGRSKIDAISLKIPVFGPMNLKIAVARFTRILGTLVRSGVPILLALEVTEQTAGNAVVAKAIASARDSIKEGDSIAGPLAASGVFPLMVTQMISIGEETGAIEAMLNRIADFYDREVQVLVDSLMSLIEPFMIIFLAVIVGGIIASIMLPMFDIYSQIH